MRPSSKKLMPINYTNQVSFKKVRKKPNTNQKYFSPPDLITQTKPFYLNNFLKPMNPHKSAFTPSNYSSKLKDQAFLLPKKSPEFSDKKTLILDLDETLVHSSFLPFENSDIVLNVEFDGIPYNIYVLVRPGAINFIRNMGKIYELVVFTASLSNYASPLLDILDPDNNIKYRLYREHCTYINGIYVKELKRLNRNLKDLIIVDNSPLAYSLDVDNGLPISTWYEDKNDEELDSISYILEFLSKAKDVRKYIKKFVYDNEIAYMEAINIIKQVEIQNKTDIDSKNNNNTYMNKTNVSNNVNKSNDDNNIIINYMNNYNNTDNINLVNNKINNFSDKIDFNINPMSKGSSSSIEESKNDDTKKNVIKLKKNKDGSSIDKNDNVYSLHDIVTMSNNIKKQKLFLVNNSKVKNSKTFRLAQKNIKNKNNILPSNNINALFPLSFHFSKTTKNIMNHKSYYKFNNNNNASNSQSKDKNVLKNNFISSIHDKLKNNSKSKYTNLLNQFGSGIVSNYKKILEKNKNLIKFQKFAVGNTQKSKKLRISSSVGNHRNFSLLNNDNKFINKNYTPFHVQRSKSTGIFVQKDKQIKLKSKTPNGKFMNQNDVEVEKKQKIFNLYGDIMFDNSAKLYNIKKDNIDDIKFIRCRTSKKKLDK